jgi:hypothetical protein
MREFFKGWRRKAGCGLLVMAMAVTGGWIRSYVAEDILLASSRNRQHRANAANGKISWHAWRNDGGDGVWTTGSRQLPANHLEIMREMRSRFEPIQQTRFDEWIVPYWSIAIPLTLFSASLIFWKPHPRE